MTSRYALYFAPPAGHPLWAAGCHWLGRDPASGLTVRRQSGRDHPRRYGFHATLKPPFALRDGVDEWHLRAALKAFTVARGGFEMPALEVATLGDFIALRPVAADKSVACRPLRELADDCVRQFDGYRRPPLAHENGRRVHAGLDSQQRENVERWGYPHVFDYWRFHMSLSDALGCTTAGDRVGAELLADATRHFATALAHPLRCDGVALFVETAPGADFHLVQRFGFAR